MKLIHSLFMSTAVMLGACSGKTDSNEQVIIRPPDMTIENKLMTHEALWVMARICLLTVSPAYQ